MKTSTKIGAKTYNIDVTDDTFREVCENLGKEVVRRDGQIKELSDRIAQAHADLQASGMEVASRDEQIADMESAIKQLGETFKRRENALMQELDDSENTVGELSRKIEGYFRAMQDTNKAHSNLKLDYQTVLDENKLCNTDLVKKDGKIQELQDNIAKLQDVKSEVVRLTDELAKAKKSEETVETLRKELEDCKQLLWKEQEKYAGLNASAVDEQAKLNKSNKSLAHEIIDLNVRLAEKDKEIALLHEAQEESDAESYKQIRDLEKEIIVLKSQVTDEVPEPIEDIEDETPDPPEKPVGWFKRLFK